ncbi:DEAD/DEAH box helicase [Spirochaeta africana]|uniref:DNA/RNA helicase, superfamily II n=1 Tax=Spirochaeta africana (strain ATCC 700263 / DSM 8902 / Z-7692) TaxID=889378 RepID=H9UKZ0_SPIAZ|nr:DEAD/DEAH box helicase [Spirochaeta africana]AFG38183.1 DNA/RNA helicase, superfamily II [Spirochaeta africana DSM 8902]
MESLTFSQLELESTILDAVKRQGYTTPTPIQAQSIPVLMHGSDMLGTAQTGTGKTAAFVLPLLDRLIKNPRQPETSANPAREPAHNRNGRNSRDSRRRPVKPARPEALILAPTRELAIQIGDSLQKYGSGSGLKHTVIYGGAPKPSQAAKLRNNPDILAATPGRLMDFVGEGLIDLTGIRVLILDEADRMLDMGFIPEMRKIAAMAEDRDQTVLFSATMPREIESLAQELLTNPERVAIAPQEVTVDRITQTVLHLDREDKTKLLPALIRDHNMFRVIIFTRTKHRATRVAKLLSKAEIPADAIHGDRTQGQRQRALEGFRRGKIQALVATDVASRGIDVDDVSHVINFEIPNEAESYVHRIGRTGRAGTEGIAIALCARDEIKDLRAIERLLGSPIVVNRDHEFHQEPPRSQGRSGNTSGGGGRQKSRNRFNDSRPGRNKSGDNRQRRSGNDSFGGTNRTTGGRPGGGTGNSRGRTRAARSFSS